MLWSGQRWLFHADFEYVSCPDGNSLAERGQHGTTEKNEARWNFDENWCDAGFHDGDCRSIVSSQEDAARGDCRDGDRRSTLTSSEWHDDNFPGNDRRSRVLRHLAPGCFPC